jgi:hypothetical protein
MEQSSNSAELFQSCITLVLQLLRSANCGTESPLPVPRLTRAIDFRFDQSKDREAVSLIEIDFLSVGCVRPRPCAKLYISFFPESLVNRKGRLGVYAVAQRDLTNARKPIAWGNLPV